VARPQDRFQNRVWGFNNRLILNAQHANLVRGQNHATLRIVFHLRFMNGAIHLHCQAGGMAGKVDNIPRDHLLAAKMQAAQPVFAQVFPQNFLRFGLCLSEFTRPRSFLWVNLLAITMFLGDISEEPLSFQFPT